jgi:microcystin-dependent protein
MCWKCGTLGATSKPAWLTTDGTPQAEFMRRLFIPDSEAWLAIVSGALVPLIYAENWQLFGTSTPEACADRALVMVLKFLRDNGMIGTIFAYPGDLLPDGFLECDGQSYQRVEYPALYAALHSTYHNNADSFRVPDLRGRTIVGAGQGDSLSERQMGDVDGAESHQLTEAQLPAHAHLYTPPVLNLDLESPGVPDILGAGIGIPTNTSSAGGNEAHNKLPPFHVLRWVIVAK